MKLNEKLQEIASEKKSEWIQKSKRDFENKGARTNARKVALRVLSILKQQGISQVELAVRMGVTRQQVAKIVKGKENFTFETIDKLERALGVTIMTIGSTIIPAHSTRTALTGQITLPWQELQDVVSSFILNYTQAPSYWQFKRNLLLKPLGGNFRLCTLNSSLNYKDADLNQVSGMYLANQCKVILIESKQTIADETKRIAATGISDYCTS